MHAVRFSAFLLLLICSFLWSCEAETTSTDEEVSQETLIGRWELFSAYRNGESTESLDGTYLEFEDGQMTTNFTGLTVQTPVALDEQQLKQEDQVYTITNLSNDTLSLTTTLMNYDFRLHFAKVD